MFHSIIDIRIYMNGTFGREHKDCRDHFRQNRVHGILEMFTSILLRWLTILSETVTTKSLYSGLI